MRSIYWVPKINLKTKNVYKIFIKIYFILKDQGQWPEISDCPSKNLSEFSSQHGLGSFLILECPVESLFKSNLKGTKKLLMYVSKVSCFCLPVGT